jgi:tripartite-type tricarboxylate transporter receptor subunit TctC
MNRRTLIAALTSVAAFSLSAAAQTPDDYPNRPIRIIVTQAAGSGVDQQARVLAQKMGELWGQQGVVENRPGANAIIGMEAGAKAAPDGYTLIYASVSALGDEHLHLQETPLRSGTRFRADHPDGRQPDGRGGQSGVGPQVDQGHR